MGDCVWFATSFLVVEDVVLEINGLGAKICEFDPLFVSVLAFWVGEDFGDFYHGGVGLGGVLIRIDF